MLGRLNDVGGREEPTALDYDKLLTLSSDLGYHLLLSGAEIYRVEESIQRLLWAYGVQEADPFVIPNCIIVSMVTPEGRSMTQVRRMPSHGTDIDLLECFNDLCRHLCVEKPDLDEARVRLEAARKACRSYSLPAILASYFMGTAAFALFFKGSLRDSLCAGICGVIIGLVVSALVWVFARPLMGIFVEAKEVEVIQEGIRYLHIEGAFYCGIGCLFLLYGLYRALGKPGMSVVLTVISLGTRVALAYILSSFPAIGVVGIWWSVPIGWALADLVGLLYYAFRKDRLLA